MKHGLKGHDLYPVWKGMKQRCNDINAENYIHYGGRGISVCPEWEINFKSFYDWALQNGWVNGLKIDRINNNGNYTPENCQIVSHSKNCRNRRHTHMITISGVSMSMMDWCEKQNLNYSTVRTRINQLKWSPEKALNILPCS